MTTKTPRIFDNAPRSLSADIGSMPRSLLAVYRMGAAGFH